MRYWLDTEFIEDGHTIDLISIGIVAEDGREYYAINYDCDFDRASDWVKENVINQLPPKPLIGMYDNQSEVRKQGWWNKEEIVRQVEEFCNPAKYGKPEFWGYYADYDWVVFCQLFGTMMDLPKDFPMYCNDIKQECDRLGSPDLPKQEDGLHNALEDARWNKQVFNFLCSIAEEIS